MSNKVRLLHTSDVHLGYDSTSALARHALEAVVDCARSTKVDALLIAGDFFDNNRVKDDLVEFAVQELSRLDRPVIILPGNHDCLVPESVYRRPSFARRPDHIYLIEDDHERGLHFGDIDLHVWGRPVVDHHRGFRPLADVPRRRPTGHRVIMAHGHYEEPDDKNYRSSPIFAEEIAAADCDYIALGHWDRRVDISAGDVVAYYSGAPYTVHLGEALLVELNGGRPSIEEIPLG